MTEDKPVVDISKVEPGSPEESKVLEQLNELVQYKLSNNNVPTPMFRMKHISHLDLDGYGATLLSESMRLFYPDGAIELETANILPSKLASELAITLDNIDAYDIVIITDLAISKAVLEMIMNHPQKDKIHIFDHHITDVKETANLENVVITEYSPIHENELTCATELYYNFLKNDRIFSVIQDPDTLEMFDYFVECIRVYDTFEFWHDRNVSKEDKPRSHYDAPRLNTLFHIMDRNEFKEFIFYYFQGKGKSTTPRIDGTAVYYVVDDESKIPDKLYLTDFTPAYPWVPKILELENNKNVKYVETAIRRLTKTKFNSSVFRNGHLYELNYNIGVIYAERSSPMIANEALERYDDIDICAVVSNNQVSLYSNRDRIYVCEIAKIFGGGGHDSAAGFTIPYAIAAVLNMNHFARILECAGNLSPDQIEFDDPDVTDTN